MGLAIVHGIVTSYGGEIRVESAPGEGSVFSIYLRRIAGTSEILSTNPTRAIREGQGCILWVDDEPLLSRMGREMLESLGYEVVACINGVEALEIFRDMPYRFDVVITDQTMPILTGEKLAQEIRLIRADIAIILCTGFSHLIDEEKAVAMGLNAFFMKPLDRQFLAYTLEQVLGQRSRVSPPVVPSDM